MVDSVQVHLAAALVHAVPGAEAQLRCGDRERLVVSRHPAADLTPSAFRQLVIAARANPLEPHATTGVGALAVRELTIGGAIQDLGGGVVRSVDVIGGEQRWLATTLAWDAVQRLLASWPADDAAVRGVAATIAPDPELGVTLLRLTEDGTVSDTDLDRTAASASAALLVEELVASLDSQATDAGT